MSKNAGYTLKIKADSGYRSDESGRTDAECYRVALAALDGQLGTDVNLLKSAPELLEALEYALPYLQECVPNPRNGVNADCSVDVNCVDRARAAIAKAIGGGVTYERYRLEQGT